jgi:predicted NAD/FAD-dependent oxidoreductase
LSSRHPFIQALGKEIAHWFNGIGEAKRDRINMNRQSRQRRNYISNPGNAPVADCLCQQLDTRIGAKVQVIGEFD